MSLPCFSNIVLQLVEDIANHSFDPNSRTLTIRVEGNIAKYVHASTLI